MKRDEGLSSVSIWGLSRNRTSTRAGGSDHLCWRASGVSGGLYTGNDCTEDCGRCPTGGLGVYRTTLEMLRRFSWIRIKNPGGEIASGVKSMVGDAGFEPATSGM